MRSRFPTFMTMVLTAMLVGCAAGPDPRLEANKALVERFVAALNAQDWAAFDTLLSADFVRHSAATPGSEVTSPAAFVAMQRTFLTMAPDQHVTLDLLVAEGDHAAVRATYAGTQTGPAEGIPVVTGKAFSLPFLSIFRMEEGRIAEMWVEWDNVAFLTQLGLFPPPASPTE